MPLVAQVRPSTVAAQMAAGAAQQARTVATVAKAPAGALMTERRSIASGGAQVAPRPMPAPGAAPDPGYAAPSGASAPIRSEVPYGPPPPPPKAGPPVALLVAGGVVVVGVAAFLLLGRG